MAGSLKSIDTSDQLSGMPGKVIGKVADYLVGQIEVATGGQSSDNASPDVVVRGENRCRDATAKSAS
ncbi:MAG: hypothetical protein EBZ13_01275 [Planctomycetia bacterium]|nr:hypothetical protein [Planctomycetia bacterium]